MTQSTTRKGGKEKERVRESNHVVRRSKCVGAEYV